MAGPEPDTAKDKRKPSIWNLLLCVSISLIGEFPIAQLPESERDHSPLKHRVLSFYALAAYPFLPCKDGIDFCRCPSRKSLDSEHIARLGSQMHLILDEWSYSKSLSLGFLVCSLSNLQGFCENKWQ